MDEELEGTIRQILYHWANRKTGTSGGAYEVHQAYLDAGYVKLSSNQELPYNPYEYGENPNMNDGRTANYHQQRSQGYKRCRKDMSDFRRVEL